MKIYRLLCVALLAVSASSYAEYPNSAYSFADVESEVGCTSKYGDEKKEDIFNSKYKNNWMTWRGKVFDSGKGTADLDINGFMPDLSVTFLDKQEGYDLDKDTVITVKFLMSSLGGCFLSFGGKSAVIQN